MKSYEEEEYPKSLLQRECPRLEGICKKNWGRSLLSWSSEKVGIHGSDPLSSMSVRYAKNWVVPRKVFSSHGMKGLFIIFRRDKEMKEIPTTYSPKEIEELNYKNWEEKKYFHAEPGEGKAYSIIMPPPNVTGQLHMGHALDNTLQDILIRWRRMQGYRTLWMPGSDHAGIATQIKVEEQLRSEGKSRYDLGREAFIERVWEWKEKYGGEIQNQLKRIGVSCDWDKERFTMDEGCSEAVKEVFIGLYEKGLIYRGYRIINWCVRCETALSDVEVEHEDRDGHLWQIRYPVVGEEGKYLEIATTRPETMLGDVAVAVHPEDERYQELIGKKLLLPLANREIPIIADDSVEKEFGTGAVKITPAHDPNDYEMGKRHNLEELIVMDEKGFMNKEAGKFSGLERYEARKTIVKELEDKGFLVKIIDHPHSVGQCQRCTTVVEPRLSRQWFVDMKPLAEPAIKVVQEQEIQFVPERFSRTYMQWMENIRDWCISRQLWWGHRIPAWYCQSCDEVIVGRTEPKECPKCKSGNLKQDEDVLDTWFSSGLWPFSTMGWPEQTDLLKTFYPTSVLVTGYDIIFFWVARMIALGKEFTGEIPFDKVFIHGLVRDSQGRKMSKSLGNGIDPLEVIDEYGADALRFTLVTGNTPGNDMRFYMERVEANRNFANKIWNASRFVLMNLGDEALPKEFSNLTLDDRWILSRYNQTVEEVTTNLEKFELGEAARSIYEFLWNEYCDWYIEMAKRRLYDSENKDGQQMTRKVLTHVLSGTLALLHPFMPFLTESLWQALPHEGEALITFQWPQANLNEVDPKAIEEMNVLMNTIRSIRNMRAEIGAHPSQKSEVILFAQTHEVCEFLKNQTLFFESLAAAAPLTVKTFEESRPENALTQVIPGIEIYLPLKGLIDADKETARLDKEIAGLDKVINQISGKLKNEGFLAKAPLEVVEKEKEKLQEATERKVALAERKEFLKGL